MKTAAIIFFIFLISLACKREKMWFNDTTVEGILLDSTTLESFNDIEIELYRYDKKGLIFPSSKRTIIRTKSTNEKGEFKIKFNRVKNNVYFLYINHIFDNITSYHLSINRNIIHSNEIPIDSVITYKLIYLVEE